MKNHINANMVVYIAIGKMNRIKEKTLIERKETLKKEREEYNKCYLEKKESKNKTTDVLIAKLQDRLVQCCIDFINENNLGDLERVDFLTLTDYRYHRNLVNGHQQQILSYLVLKLWKKMVIL